MSYPPCGRCQAVGDGVCDLHPSFGFLCAACRTYLGQGTYLYPTMVAPSILDSWDIPKFHAFKRVESSATAWWYECPHCHQVRQHQTSDFPIIYEPGACPTRVRVYATD